METFKRKPNTDCQECGKPFYARPSVKKSGSGKYCSRKCCCLADGRAIPQPYPQTKQCEHCGGDFEIVDRSKRGKRFCSYSCARVVSNTNRTGVKYKQQDPFRTKLLKEFKPVCMCPGCGYSIFVDAHHINPRKHGGNSEAENGIFLCPNHHREADHELISRETLKEWRTLADRI